MRASKFDLDLGSPEVALRLAEPRIEFPRTFEDAASALVGLEPMGWARTVSERQSRLRAFVERNGPEMFSLLCKAFHNGQIDHLSFESLLTWVQADPDARLLTSSSFLEQMSTRLSGRQIRSVKIASAMAEVCEGLQRGRKGRGGRDFLKDQRVALTAKKFFENNPEARVSEFEASAVYAAACGGKAQQYSRSKLKKLIGLYVKNRTPGAPKTKSRRQASTN